MAKEVAVIDEKLVLTITKKFNEKAAGDPELIELTSEFLPAKIKKTDVGKVNVTERIINALKEKTKDLTINGITDKEGAKEVKKWRLIAKNVRTTGVGITKSGRAALIEEQKAWIQVEKAFEEQISEIEDRLDKMEKDNQKAIDDEKIMLANLQTQRFTSRVMALSDLGVLNDTDTNKFKLGDFEIDVALVREAEDDVYEGILESFKEEAKLANQEREAETRGARNTLLEAVKGIAPEGIDLGTISQKEWETIYQPFKDAADEAKRIEEAEKEKEAKIIRDRKIDQLRLLGYVLDDTNMIFFIDGSAKIVLPVTPIVEASEEIFKAKLREAAQQANAAQEQYEEDKAQETARRDERIRKAAIGDSRKKMLAAIGHTYGKDDLGDIPDEEWETRYARAKQTYDNRQAEIAAEQLRSQSDSKQWKAFLENIQKITIPAPTSRVYKEKVQNAINHLNQIKLL